MKKLIEDKLETLRWRVANAIAGPELEEAYQDGLRHGFDAGKQRGLQDALDLLSANDDITIIADGHRAKKTKAATATADALLIGYDYAKGLLTSKTRPQFEFDKDLEDF